MTLQGINKRFVYAKDKDLTGFNEAWLGLQEVDGKLKGDCEDYAITLKREVQGFKSWNYWYCKLNGIGHCILVSPSGQTVIDNNIRVAINIEAYMNTYSISELRPYTKIELLWKFTQAWFIKQWLKVRRLIWVKKRDMT